MKEYPTVPYAEYTDFFVKNCPNYFDEIYVLLKTYGVHTRSSCQNINVPCRKINVGQKSLSYMLVSHFWNNFNKTLKTLTGPNAFKRNIQQHYFAELNKKESY